MKKSAVEWLAEKYNYIDWMRRRDEISPATADEWRFKFLNEAKEMEKKQIVNAWMDDRFPLDKYWVKRCAEQYYNETFNTKER